MLANDCTLLPELSTAFNPVLKVELHTGELGGGSKHRLLSLNLKDLVPSQKIEHLVKQEIKVTGTNTLVCTINYGQLKKEEGGEPVMITRSLINVRPLLTEFRLTKLTRSPASALSIRSESLFGLSCEADILS